MMIPRSASSLRIRSARGEVAALPGGLTFGDFSFSISASLRPPDPVAKPRARSFSASLSSTTAKTLSNVGQEFLGGGHVALAEFAFVHGDIGFANQIECCSQGHARCSNRPQGRRRIRPKLWPLRSAMPTCFPAGNFPCSSRSAKLRSRSTELAACCRPSNVKLSCRGTARWPAQSAAPKACSLCRTGRAA